MVAYCSPGSKQRILGFRVYMCHISPRKFSGDDNTYGSLTQLFETALVIAKKRGGRLQATAVL